jgi:copper chaperone CopZ
MTDTSTAAGTPVELVVGGMSCAACAARIEKRLNLLDGVAATVNYATERAYTIPAHGTVSLSPFGLDVVLQDPGSLTVGARVPLVLTFRRAGRVTVYATVTPPSTP